MSGKSFRILVLVGALGVLVAIVGNSAARAQEMDVIDIPYEKFKLKNGLTVIVHEDDKAPIVAVNVWYHVGAKNEKTGRTGLAHLFEHLMFNGSEHFNDDYFKVLQRIGATGLNGTTNSDRTNYFQNVPTTALDTVLWMESDRMGHLLGAIDQERLDEQRGVVQNEKRQGENQPYGRAFFTIMENTRPKGHPYSWSTIGYMEDLEAATLEDAHQWFKDYYGAANAVIGIAGDVTVEEVREKMERYFGHIPAGPPVTKQEVWIAKMEGEHRQTMQDRVPQSRVYKVWNISEWGSADADYLNLVSDVLATGKTSRLFKRLVYDEQIATNVNASVRLLELGGSFLITADARPDVELAKVEQAIDDELKRFLREGPTEEELRRVKTEYRANFIRGIERIGGFGGKSDILAQNEVYGGSPDYHKVTQKRIYTATANDLREAAGRWLSDGVYVLEIHPFPKFETVASDVDREAGVPWPGPPPAAKFPELKHATLYNGLKVILVERHAVPKIEFRLLVDAGYAADQFGLAGTARMALDMMDEGTTTRDALQIAEQLALLGAELSTSSNLDMSTVSLSALKENLDASLQLYADVILNPSFPPEELERLRRRRLAQIQQEKARPMGMALRVFPGLLYGEGHAYGNPLAGTGTEETAKKITRDDLVTFHQAWFKPNHSTLIVVGATTLAEIQPTLEKLLAGWEAGDVPKKNIGQVAHRDKPVVYIMDRPGAPQSVILAAHIAPPKNNPDEIAIETMNTILGGNFVARINMNLREGKHWSYGARSNIVDARGQRPFIVYAPVQTDKTKESMAEILKELNGIRGEIPVTEDELDKAKAAETLTLPGQWETMNAVANSIAEMVRFGLPDDYFETYAQKVRGLGLDDIGGAADNVVYPDKLVWVVVGDWEKIEPGIRELGIGTVTLLTPEGKAQQDAMD